MVQFSNPQTVFTDAIFMHAWQEYAHLLYTVYADSGELFLPRLLCSTLPVSFEWVLLFSSTDRKNCCAQIWPWHINCQHQELWHPHNTASSTASFGWMQFSFCMSEIHSFTHWFCSEVHKHCSYWLSMLLMVSCINTTDSWHTSMNSSHNQPVMPHLIVVFMKR